MMGGQLSAPACAIEHPFFARMYPRFAAQADERGQAEHRRKLLDGITRRVVEVGAGNGRNFRHYPASVSEVVAVEPEPRLRELAESEAASACVPVRVVAGEAAALPLEDESFDVGVASLVLCSVAEQAEALAELRRVIRPGGELRFYEHVVSPSARLARMQRLADRLFWPRLGAGCHCSRDTQLVIKASGFEVESCRRLEFKPSVLIGSWTKPHILGVARRA